MTRPLQVALFLLSFFFTGQCFASTSSCRVAKLRISDDLTSASIVLPALDGEELQFKEFAGVKRSQLWRGDSSGLLKGDTVTGSNVPLVFNWDMSANPERRDRYYSPYIRFHDGSIALASGILEAFSGNSGICWEISAPSKRSSIFVSGHQYHGKYLKNPELVPTYIVIGAKNIVKKDGLSVVADDDVAEWAVSSALQTALKAHKYFSKNLWHLYRGITLLIVAEDQDAPKLSYGGDAFVGLQTLRLRGSGWKKENREAQETLEHVVAHELFHQWNGFDMHPESGGDTMMVHEGSAEFAAALYVALQTDLKDENFSRFLSNYINGCAIRKPAGVTLNQALDSAPGRLVYDCGAALLTGVSVGDVASFDSIENNFFSRWRVLHKTKNDGSYSFSSFLREAGSEPAAASMGSSQDPTSWVWTSLKRGGATLIKGTSDDSLNAVIAGRIVAGMMSSDCNGAYGYITRPDGIELDSSVKCVHLDTNGVIEEIGGVSFTQRSTNFVDVVLETCKIFGNLKIGFKSGRTSTIKCPDGEWMNFPNLYTFELLPSGNTP